MYVSMFQNGYTIESLNNSPYIDDIHKVPCVKFWLQEEFEALQICSCNLLVFPFSIQDSVQLQELKALVPIIIQVTRSLSLFGSSMHYNQFFCAASKSAPHILCIRIQSLYSCCTSVPLQSTSLFQTLFFSVHFKIIHVEKMIETGIRSFSTRSGGWQISYNPI